MGALSYADDSTIRCPCIDGLSCRPMLDICNQFACDNFITFNSEKTIFIKFGESVLNNECLKLNNKILKCNTDIRHLRFYISIIH